MRSGCVQRCVPHFCGAGHARSAAVGSCVGRIGCVGRLMMLAHRHAERPGHVPCVPGNGRPAQGVMRPHAPQAVVRSNQILRRLPRQGPPLPDTAAAWAAPWRPREPGRSRDRDSQVELHRTARLYLIGQERVHRGGQGGGGHRDPFSARVARVTAWRAPGRGIPLPPWVLRPRKRGHSPGACLTGACGRFGRSVSTTCHGRREKRGEICYNGALWSPH